MKTTRRQFIACAIGALAWSKPAKWSPERLGIFCHLGTNEASARNALAAARAAGYSRVQIQFPWARAGDSYLKSLPGWLRGEGVEARVLGAYVNCCSPETVLMDCRREDFARAIEAAASIGARHLVAWTGGYGGDLMKSDPRNFTPAASDAIVKFLEAYTPRLEKAKLTLALETYVTLACPDAPSLRALLNRLPKSTGAVLDPPNLTPVGRYAQRDEVLREIVATLGNRVTVVHLKDFRLAPDGGGYQLPGPLGGEMNYPLYLEKVLSLPGAPPIIAEHLAPEQYAGARKKLLPLFQAAAQRLGLV